MSLLLSLTDTILMLQSFSVDASALLYMPGSKAWFAAVVKVLICRLVVYRMATNTTQTTDFTSELQRKIAHLEAVEKLASQGATTFLHADADGALSISSEISPEVVPEVYEAFQLAKQESEVITISIGAATLPSSFCVDNHSTLQPANNAVFRGQDSSNPRES